MQNYNNFKITWNDCNSESKVEKEDEMAQMVFLFIGNNEIFSNYSYDENDDYLMMIMSRHL